MYMNRVDNIGPGEVCGGAWHGSNVITITYLCHAGKIVTGFAITTGSLSLSSTAAVVVIFWWFSSAGLFARRGRHHEQQQPEIAWTLRHVTQLADRR